MKTDKLKQYISLHQNLLRERAVLETRLTQINKALGQQHAAGNGKAAGKAPRRAVTTAKRAKNPLSLKAAVIKATSAKALTKPEILSAIKKLGYRFTAKDPTNSLNVVLYTKGQFKNQSGKFSPAK